MAVAIASRYSSTACFLPARVGCEPRLALSRAHLNCEDVGRVLDDFREGFFALGEEEIAGVFALGN